MIGCKSKLSKVGIKYVPCIKCDRIFKKPAPIAFTFTYCPSTNIEVIIQADSLDWSSSVKHFTSRKSFTASMNFKLQWWVPKYVAAVSVLMVLYIGKNIVRWHWLVIILSCHHNIILPGAKLKSSWEVGSDTLNITDLSFTPHGYHRATIKIIILMYWDIVWGNYWKACTPIHNSTYSAATR